MGDFHTGDHHPYSFAFDTIFESRNDFFTKNEHIGENIIFEIEKTEIDDYKSLKRAVQDKPNERVLVGLYRKGKKMSKTITLAERERDKYTFEVDMPEIPDFKVILDTEELEASIESIKEELEQLKEELEKLKKNLK